MTATLVQLVETVKAKAAAAKLGLKTVKLHEGELTGTAKSSFTAPALFVDLTGGKAEDAGSGEILFGAQLRAFIVVKHAGGKEERSIAALGLVERVMLLIHQSAWGLTGLDPAEVQEAKNLTSALADAAGLEIWSVSWRQPVLLGESVWDEEDAILATTVEPGSLL